ncbi:MAG: hypothetical protein PHR27_08805 [Candidatus Cloacimonetes bacterium]|nr:hypothetical protein [Candidatus Cloacimonadota bacterium]
MLLDSSAAGLLCCWTPLLLDSMLLDSMLLDSMLLDSMLLDSMLLDSMLLDSMRLASSKASGLGKRARREKESHLEKEHVTCSAGETPAIQQGLRP